MLYKVNNQQEFTLQSEAIILAFAVICTCQLFFMHFYLVWWYIDISIFTYNILKYVLLILCIIKQRCDTENDQTEFTLQ